MTGQMREGFDFTGHMRLLCADIVSRLQPLSHIDLSSVAVGYCQARKRVDHGLYAALTPMRFAAGRLVEVWDGRQWTFERLFDESGREMLYILNFYLPRFLDLDFRDKLVTVMHELWHINPAFDGDLRRHPGRYHLHTHSQQDYDAQMLRLVERWLAAGPPREVYAFLHCDFDELRCRFGPVYGTRYAAPKMIPLPRAASEKSKLRRAGELPLEG